MTTKQSPPITKIAVDGIRIAQAIAGDENAPPILMLHGWGANIGLLWPLAERLVNMGYRVYVPDMPGFGESDHPPVAWTVHDYVRFVLAYADYHHIEQFHLFGHSFGGRLGLILGAEHHNRIIKMVLADSAGIRSKLPLMTQIRLTLYKTIRTGLNSIGLNKLSEKLRTWYNGRYGSQDFKDVSGVMRETFVKVVNEDLREYAVRVGVSTLLIWGSNDEDTPLWQGKSLEKLIPDAGLVVFSGAGHYSYLENQIQTTQAMDALFKGASH
jgi:pimeloyl-ACP methyl ester carboxylesterase